MTSEDELLELETAAIQSIDGELRGPALKAVARIRELLAQLPESMEHCTIEFKECEHGHGRLVATNWVDHGCHFCRIRELEAQLKEANAHLHEIEKTYWIEGWSLSKRASWMKKLAEEYLDKTTARAAQESKQ